jgi:hypothetical protein
MFGTITIIIVPFHTLDAFVAFLVGLTVLLTIDPQHHWRKV